MSPADDTNTNVNRYILEAAVGERLLTSEQLWEIREHVAKAWYNLTRKQRISRELVGLQWRGRVLQPGDALLTDVANYLKHVVVRQEWPPSMSLTAYRESLRKAVRDPDSGLMTSTYRDKGCHLSIVRRSQELKGPGGHEWLLVEYRVSTGNIATAFQLEEGLSYLDRPGRREQRWLRRPQ